MRKNKKKSETHSYQGMHTLFQKKYALYQVIFEDNTKTECFKAEMFRIVSRNGKDGVKDFLIQSGNLPIQRKGM